MCKKTQMRRMSVRYCFAVLAVIMSANLSRSDDGGIIRVRGKGVGETEAIALKDAYRDAIESAVGMYVDAEQEVENYRLVKDEILTQSNAVIEDYEITDKRNIRGLVSVTIVAKVRKQALTKRLSGKTSAKILAVDDSLKSFHAESTTTAKRNGDGAALLKKELDNLHVFAQLYDVALATGRPVVLEDGGDMVEVAWLFKLEVDFKRYSKEFLPHMERVLKQISIAEPRSFRATESKESGRRNGNFERFVAESNAEHATYDELCNDGMGDTFRLSSPFFGDALFVGKNSPPYSLCKEDPPSPLDVVVIGSANKSLTLVKGAVYALDPASCAVYEAWNDAQGHEKCRYSVVFCDENGSEVSCGMVDFGTYGMLSFEGFWGAGSHYMWMITPWVGTDAVAYYKWFKFKIGKDDLPHIKTIKVEPID